MEAHRLKNTNLETVEIYLPDPAIRRQVEEALELVPKEKGYEVLLIEPYYKSLLSHSVEVDNNLRASSLLLTYIDLYHFPLRGEEQAEFMAVRAPFLKKVYKRK